MTTRPTTRRTVTDRLRPRRSAALGAAVALTLSLGACGQAQEGAAARAEPAAAEQSAPAVEGTSDEALVESLPGDWENGNAEVNGVNLHYVTGGEGPPLVLLPGHPQTWWSYAKIMPQLAQDHTVIAVDIRGMGSSDKPQDGYDKRTMAEDVHQLTQQLGHDRVDIAGHDIGAMVAWAYAANHPESTNRLAMLDVAHPDESFESIPMLPEVGAVGEDVTAEQPAYTWWFAFHQVEGLPEALLDEDEDARRYTDFILDYHLTDDDAMTPQDRAVYEEAYSTPDAIRAGNDWYQAFPQDIQDGYTYPVLQMPVLGLGGEFTGATWLEAARDDAADFELVTVPDSGHFIVDEQPGFVADQMSAFFAAP